MKKKRFPVEQIVAVLKRAEVVVPVAELIRKVEISKETFYLDCPVICTKASVSVARL